MNRYPRFIKDGRGNRMIVPKEAGYTDSTTYAGFVEDALPGEIAVIDPDTKAILTALTPLEAGDKFQLVQKLNTVEKEVAYSDVYTFKPKCLTATAIIAGVNQSITATVTSAATDKSDVFELAIIDQTFPGGLNKNHMFEFASVTGAETVEQVAAGIFENYQAVSERIDLPFVITIAGAVLTITTKSKETNLVVGVNQQLVATIATATAYVAANGTGETTYMEELAGAGYDGLSNWAEHEFSDMGNMTPFAKKGCTYDEIKINNPQSFETLGHVPSMMLTTESPTVIRVETTTVGTTGSAALTALKTIFGL